MSRLVRPERTPLANLLMAMDDMRAAIESPGCHSCRFPKEKLLLLLRQRARFIRRRRERRRAACRKRTDGSASEEVDMRRRTIPGL